MKLRATIVIDLDADDFMDAAKKQQHLDGVAKDLSKVYETVSMDFRERREFKARKGAAPMGRPRKTAKKKVKA